MRVNVEQDGTAILHVRKWSGQGGYEWGAAGPDDSRKLLWEEEAKLFSTLADIGFWTLPARVEDPYSIVLDGVGWFIEGVKDGHCHAIVRYSSPLTEVFAKSLLRDVAGIDPNDTSKPRGPTN